MIDVFAFACRHVSRPEWEYTIVNATTAGKARYEYFLDVSDPLPDVRFTDIRVRKLGPAHTSDDFRRNALYRGMPDVRCGDPVRVGDCDGVIVGHNSSANFNVLFDSGRFAGQTLNCHPAGVEPLREVSEK